MERYFIDKKSKVKEVKLPVSRRHNGHYILDDFYDIPLPTSSEHIYALTNDKELCRHTGDPMIWLYVDLPDKKMQKASWKDFNQILDVKEKYMQLFSELNESSKESEKKYSENAKRFEGILSLFRDKGLTQEKLDELEFEVVYGQKKWDAAELVSDYGFAENAARVAAERMNENAKKNIATGLSAAAVTTPAKAPAKPNAQERER